MFKKVFRSWVHELAQGREYLLTKQAAFALGKTDQTLRAWSCFGRGPIKPQKVGKVLHWSVRDIEMHLRVSVE